MSTTITLATLLSGIISGVWFAWLFAVRHEGNPASDIDLQVACAGEQHGKLLLEIIALVTNRGRVQQEYRDFRLGVRYLLPADPIEDGDIKINWQLRCDRTIDQRIGAAKRYFANSSYIKPRLAFRHSYVTFIPAEATFVWVQCSFLFLDRRRWFSLSRALEKKNMQKLFSVSSLFAPKQNERSR